MSAESAEAATRRTTAGERPPPYSRGELTAMGLDPERLPRHVAIIMDGNGRWARTKGWMRIKGHETGANTVRAITEESARLGLRQLTLYAFSSENWRRPSQEIAFLMKLLGRYLVDERPTLMRNNIRLATIGETERLPEEARNTLAETMEITRANTGLVLCLALSYGGRQEILAAVQRIAREAAAGKVRADQIDEAFFSKQLYQPGMPELDLLVRTAGEYRVSNFLLWQVSYAELWTTPVLWPDFRTEHFREALRDFAKRTRSFGAVLE